MWIPDDDFRIERKVDESYRPYYFIYSNDNGDHLGIDGRKLNKLSFNSLKEMYLSIQEMRGNVDIYESDVPYCTKYLIDKYKNEDNTIMSPLAMAHGQLVDGYAYIFSKESVADMVINQLNKNKCDDEDE